MDASDENGVKDKEAEKTGEGRRARGSDRRRCFIIGPIDEPGTPERKRADLVFKYIVSPALEPFGYDPIRADQISEPGQITAQIIQYVIESPLVIADLTGRNPNVFYELALRHAVKKPLIQMIEKGEPLPFDVANQRTIFYDVDLESAENAKQELIRQVEAIQKGTAELGNPISASVDLVALKGSSDPQGRLLSEMMAMLHEMRMRLDRLDCRPIPTGNREEATNQKHHNHE